MYNTSFHTSDYNKNELVRQYVWFKSFYLRIPIIPIPELVFPGGGARSNINDMTHFLIMHATNGTYDGVRILKKSSVQEMHRAQYPESLDEGFHHGLGWYFKNYTENETLGGHSGTHFGAFSIMKLRYSDRVGILYFYNQHSYLLGNFKKTPDFEKEAAAGIREALLEKASEL
jgi:CubicO group peptidase (beta-lactamase class C family)